MNWDMLLTPDESRICTWVGRKRFQNANRLDRDPGDGPPHTHDRMDIRGAHCEFSASLILNLSWRPSIGRIRDRDVGGLIEVRSTDLSHGRLIVKPKDIQKSPCVPFALVMQVSALQYRLLGWQFAAEAKTSPFLTQHGDPAHFVKQSDLRSNDTLLEWITEQRQAGNGLHNMKIAA